MMNKDIVYIFKQIASILVIKGENPFRIRAYERAALNIESMPEDIGHFVKQDMVQSIPGIGKDLADKVREIVLTGKLKYLEDLKKDIPQGLMDILNVPGIGPKTAKLLYEKLDIQDIVMLERMAHAGKIRELPGIRKKTEDNIIKGIEILKRGRERMDIKTAADTARYFIKRMKKMKEVKKINVAGSLRRMKDTVRDIDILVVSDSPGKVIDRFSALADVKDITAKGRTKSSVVTNDGVQVGMRVVKGPEYGAAIMYFTGSKAHNIKLRQLAIEKDLKLNEYGIFKEDKRIAGKTEREMYKALGLPYIVPELREDRGEFEAGFHGRLPDLIELKDIKGDLHTHSTWSDGGSSIEDVVREARRLKYEYIAITDHSQGLKVARGLNTDELAIKKKEIDTLRRKYNDIRILYGAEVDIDAEGRLDYPDDILKEMDIVIGAVHSGFKQSKEKQTARIIRACQNKYVDIIAHPTGRLHGAREAYEVDFGEVFKACKDTNTYLEINSFPQRLDLNDIHARMAKEAGVKIAINTDAHKSDQLSLMRFGIAVAKRAWLEKKDVLNVLSYEDIAKILL